MLGSLASEKRTAQAHAADLEARLAQATEDRLKRAKRSRESRAVAAQRLSAAESRASIAEARVREAAQRLIVSERRVRNAERLAEAAARSALVTGADSSETSSSGGDLSGGLSPGDANAWMPGETRLEGVAGVQIDTLAGVVEGHCGCSSENALEAIPEAADATNTPPKHKTISEDLVNRMDRSSRKARADIENRTCDANAPVVSRAPSTAVDSDITPAVPAGTTEEEIGNSGVVYSPPVREKQAEDKQDIELEGESARVQPQGDTPENYQANDGSRDSKTGDEGQGDLPSLTYANRRVKEAEDQAQALRAELEKAKAQVRLCCNRTRW